MLKSFLAVLFLPAVLHAAPPARSTAVHATVSRSSVTAVRPCVPSRSIATSLLHRNSYVSIGGSCYGNYNNYYNNTPLICYTPGYCTSTYVDPQEQRIYQMQQNVQILQLQLQLQQLQQQVYFQQKQFEAEKRQVDPVRDPNSLVQ